MSIASKLYASAVILVALGLAVIVLLSGLSRTALDAGRFGAANALWGSRGPAAAALAETLADKQPRAASRLAHRALDRSLAHPQAIRVLALAAEARGRDAAAAYLMSVGGQWGWRDTPTQFWLLQRAVNTGDEAAAMQHIDALLRRRQGREALFVLLAALTNASPEGLNAAVDHLEQKPKWRPDYLAALVDPAIDVAGTERIARRLKGTDARFTRTEAGSLTKAIVARGDYRRAARLWTDLFPGDPAVAGTGATALGWPPGGFVDAALPFEWRLSPVAGADVHAARGDRDALEIAVYDRPQGVIATRLVILEAGRYALAMPGDMSGEAPIFGWSHGCVPDGPRDDARQVGARRWEFDVPAGCAASEVSLHIADPGTTGVQRIAIGAPVLTRLANGR